MITAYQQMLLNEAARLRIKLTVIDGKLVFDFSNIASYMFCNLMMKAQVTAALRNEIEKWWREKTQS